MSDYVRQHPLLVVIEGLRSAPSYIGIAFIFSFTAGSAMNQFVLFFIGALFFLLLLNLAFAAVNWMFFYYRYENGYMHIRHGIIFKKERSIKRERIQSINVYTNIVQRAVGLATLQIKTAGTEETEVNLRALTLTEIDAIRSSLKGVSTEEGDAIEEPASVRKLEGRDLWLAGATSGRFLILFSVIAFIGSQLFAYLPGTVFDMLIDEVTSIPLDTIAMLLVALLVLSYILSVVVFVVQYYGFRIERYDDRLELRWGVIKQNHITVGLHRIQALSVQEGLIRQPLGLCTLLMEVAGGDSEGGQEQVSMLLPLIRTEEVAGLLSEVLPEYGLPDTYEPLPERARIRYLIRALVPTLAVSFIIWQLLADNGQPYGFLVLALLIPAAVLGLSRHSNGGSSVDGTQLTLRFRDINRYHVLIKRRHAQSMTVTANPLQRYKTLRTLNVPVLSSPLAKIFDLKDIDSQEAQRIWCWYSQRSRCKGRQDS